MHHGAHCAPHLELYTMVHIIFFTRHKHKYFLCQPLKNGAQAASSKTPGGHNTGPASTRDRQGVGHNPKCK